MTWVLTICITTSAGGHTLTTHLRVVLFLVGDQGEDETLGVQGDVLTELSAIMVT